MSDEAVAPASPAPSASPTLWIREVVRLPESGPEDRLRFMPGVNVLVGAPNTGKSKWVQMIDYVFTGDKKPEDEFDADIAAKYHTIQATLMVGAEAWAVERSWTDPKLVSKVSVNGEALTLHAFSLKLLDALGIPLLHFPQGNPYGPRTWPELGWRGLFRHIYRRQSFWSDLADRQPESEQHACLLQFVGLAEVLFSEGYARLVKLEKTIQQMQDRRTQFVAMLQEVSRDIVTEAELGVALTPDSLNASIERLKAEIEANQGKRAATLDELLTATAARPQTGDAVFDRDAAETLGRELGELQTRDEANTALLTRSELRIVELKAHRVLIAEELGRMERAVTAGTLLADLKITHCPACDRAIERPSGEAHECYLCKRPNNAAADPSVAARRLDFERAQLADELQETDELIAMLTKELARLRTERAHVEDGIARAKSRLRPIRVAAAAVLPPELALLDQETGRLQERIAQLQRVRATLGKRESIAKEIEQIQAEVVELEKLVAEQSKALDFQSASDLLTDGMNTYLNAIEEVRPKSWTPPQVDFLLRQRGFDVRVGRVNWRTKLGGTLTLFFLLAYHYALMTLTGRPGRHFPGLCILDFPAQLDGVRVSDSENFVLVPFVRLMAQTPPLRQLIAAGSSFAGLEGAHRVELSKVWT